MRHPDGTPIAIEGLWDLAFGDGGKNDGKTNELFFHAGLNAVNFVGNGLFGRIKAAGPDDASEQACFSPWVSPSKLNDNSGAVSDDPLHPQKDALDRL